MIIKAVKSLVAVCAVAAILVSAAPASSAPKAPAFGPSIESVDYDGQEKCSPSPKPGVLAFQRMVLREYPGMGAGSISRACNVGGTSEHKEGRAWDMSASAASASNRRTVDRLLEWLLKEDRYGNDAAMARRLGIMYLIWNKKIWGSWGGWDTYCVMKKGVCRDPDDKDVLSPHTDHVHFSFSWAGARMKTSFWNPSRSFVSAFAPTPSGNGYWAAGRDGSILLSGAAGYYGAKSDGYLTQPVVDMAATPTGGGYWLLTRNGRVFALGDALYRGKPKTQFRAVGIAPTPTGRGYWLSARSGRVQAFGDAKKFGSLTDTDAQIVDIAATPTGLGYWLFSDHGRVFPFGDAQMFGGAADEEISSPIVAADNDGADGYWMVSESGRVLSFGSADYFGGTADKKLSAPIASMAAAPFGEGYWLMTTQGRVFAFGEAGVTGELRRAGSPARLVIPTLEPTESI